jgi:hypothetical protein
MWSTNTAATAAAVNTNNSPTMVILHVYELQPDPSQQTHAPSATDRALLMVSGILPTIGMGAYHTSLEISGLKYTFAAGAGVMVGRSNGPDVGVPRGAKYEKSIPLGEAVRSSRAELQDIVKRLSSLFFTSTSYHLVHRNCNHFSETLAVALLVMEPSETTPLQSYPRWLNRLANTGAMVLTKKENVVPCRVTDEARLAAGY